MSISSSFDRVVGILGVGLLGGSVAAALKARKSSWGVVGIGRNVERLRAAASLGLLDSYVSDLETCDPTWDFVVVATPVDRIADDVVAMAGVSRPGTLITDVGSVKAPICRQLGNLVSHFVGSHPMAGSEKQGFEAARADLFEGRVTVVTPTEETPKRALDTVIEFWESLGSKVVVMSPEDHDRTVAVTSHVPHVVAAALAGVLKSEQRQLAATGFRDTTRIALGDPDLWVAILMNNANAILDSLREFQGALSSFEEAIRCQDPERLRQLLMDAKAKRNLL